MSSNIFANASVKACHDISGFVAMSPCMHQPDFDHPLQVHECWPGKIGGGGGYGRWVKLVGLLRCRRNGWFAFLCLKEQILKGKNFVGKGGTILTFGHGPVIRVNVVEGGSETTTVDLTT
ncbi:hypothetical protein LIER_36755 [Lithospermum erythrorhizon]|uniref:Uncharacterized protein n=1 Tax=Lithospermum erythrorhizon TaxID=34254 RepID=A0AAV3PAE3_LITER